MINDLSLTTILLWNKKKRLSHFKQDVLFIGSNEVDSKSENHDLLLLKYEQSTDTAHA